MGASRRRRQLGTLLGVGLTTALLATLIHEQSLHYEDAALLGRSRAAGGFVTGDAEPGSGSPEVAALEVKVKKARSQLAKLQPKSTYIVVDATNNRLFLRKGNELIRTAVCSAGSGYVLRDGPSGRTWTFDSPEGEFRVQTRLVDPVWRKPDWAFLEASLPVPKDPAERLEAGVLGRYALYFGNGYMIHGTLYERLLGRNVTHGCIRVGRDDLAAVYDASPVGTRIFIY